MNAPPSPARVGWRRALWAGLLSLVQPGLGQIYAGAWRLGFVLFAIALGGMILIYLMTWATAPTPAALACFVAIGAAVIVFQAGAAVDAVIRVRRLHETIQRPWYRSTWVAAIVMFGITIYGPSVVPIDGYGWRSFSVASSSNGPNLLVGDIVMADIRRPGVLPDLGDVAVFQNPRQPDVDYIKRVIGLPGDRVQMRRGTLYLNGRAVPRDATGTWPPTGRFEAKIYRETLPNGRAYNILEVSDDQTQDDTEEFSVPPGHIFVLGDNRDNSVDSRMPRDVGYVPQENIYGRVLTVYWARDLSRLFKAVE